MSMKTSENNSSLNKIGGSETKSEDPENKSIKERTIEIRVAGKVQKVGFRNCVRNIAQKLSIKGEVMNLPDGSVRILASGEHVLLEKFLAMLYCCPRAIIRDISTKEIEYIVFNIFCIRRL